jgi:hypothetical protein
LPSPPAVTVPLPGGAPIIPAVNVPLPGGAPAPAVNVPLPAPILPAYAVNGALAAQGITVDMLLAKGWTTEALLQAGHIFAQ